MITKKDILQIAKTQLALDFNCKVSDFEKDCNTIVQNTINSDSRIYNNDGSFFKILCFGARATIFASPLIIQWCEERLGNADAAWLFEYSKLRAIDNKLHEFGHEIADIHQYYLPNTDINEVKPMHSVKWFEQDDIQQFRNDIRFTEAFAFNEKTPDILAVAAYDGDNIMGMAGASADSKTMWQIGIDVLPEYRGKGIGTNLVSLLKKEVLRRGRVPFYGTVQSHFYSQNIALNAGFFPAWAELYSEIIK